MIDHAWRTLKAGYATRGGSLKENFFVPCFSSCTSYRRAAGYFSSSALVTWAEGFRKNESAELKLQLLISPELSGSDKTALEKALTPAERREILRSTVDVLIDSVLARPTSESDRTNFLLWLIASGRLEIKFAVPAHMNQAGMFHQKIGIFDFPGDDKVAFDGSANESSGGHERNYESLQVFRSWESADLERVGFVEEEFRHLWEGLDEQLVVEPLSQSVLAKIKARAPANNPYAQQPLAPKTMPAINQRWRHQERAVSAFLAARRGVLEMATGTGKTKTALRIAAELFQRGEADSIIVATDGTDLLSQWFDEFTEWRAEYRPELIIYRHFAATHEGMGYVLSPRSATLIVSSAQLAKYLPQLSAAQAKRTLLIHDEVHGLGAPSLRTALAGMHERLGYVLGLSATPEREYDEEGTSFISRELGPVIFRFPLEEAIKRGILVGFDYEALPYELTEDDRARLKAVYSKKAARQASGSPMSQEELWTELSKVYKTAEQKPSVFADYLVEHPEILYGSILFVEEMAYGARILPMLHSAGVKYRTYYANDDRENLAMFGRGEIDCLVTCHKVSQGIDIRSLRTVILFSSARAKLETIQRIGRCLRSDPANPAKRALVVDFVLTENGEQREGSADADRQVWLAGLSEVRRHDGD